MEFWGSGHMLGIYPTEHKFGAFAISPTEEGKTTPYPGLRSDIRQALSDLIKPHPVVFEQIPLDDNSNMVYWPLTDVRSEKWFKKHIVLIGDAAVGFLPTSDAGASMAMESAAVLADELTRTDQYHLDWALLLYEKRRKPRVEAAQDDSRSLAKHMFVKSAVSSQIRNYMLRQHSIKSISESIDKSFQTPI
jgi:2-polyprenyl-6-methoxyphenol hydroxylase-like FAD-dependent oxidoreductase